MKDKIIEEIRVIRKKMDKQIEKDPQKFRDEIAAIQKKYRSRLVALGPRLKKKSAAVSQSSRSACARLIRTYVYEEMKTKNGSRFSQAEFVPGN
jgi:ElaB/YqjD/DUF883 family membrane-anchored ribosome-binding protein